MIEYNCKEPLISIHIPKCGGTSFLEILQKWFGETLYSHYYDEKNNAFPEKVKIKKTFFNNFRSGICIHGHFNMNRGFGIPDYYPQIKQFITIIRDPLEIQISRYFHWKKQEETGNNYRGGEQMNFQYHDIDEFLEKTESAMLLHFPVKLTGENYKDCMESKFIHIGIIEKFQKSIDTIADKLGKSRISVSHKNTTRKTEMPSTSSINKFKEKSKLEYMVYEYVLKLNK